LKGMDPRIREDDGLVNQLLNYYIILKTHTQ
jgi:hypothetical protein